MTNKNLIIQLNENSIKFTLFSQNISTIILYDKTTPLENDFSFTNLNSIFKQFTNLRDILTTKYNFDLLNDNVYVVNNNSFTKTLIEQYKDNDDNFETNLKTHLNSKYPNEEIIYLNIFSKSNQNYVVVELLNRRLKNIISDILKTNNFKNIRFFSINKIKQSYFKNIADQNLIVLEANYFSTNITNFTNGSISKVETNNLGMFNILEQIVKAMKISFLEAKEMFSNLASIPKEDVIDNRIIFSKQIEGKVVNFTKKDLSEIITKTINDFINAIKNYLNSKIIVSGDITSLQGLLKYMKKYLNHEDVEFFNNQFIGLNDFDSLLTNGIIKQVNSFNDLNNEIFEKSQIDKGTSITRFFKKLISFN